MLKIRRTNARNICGSPWKSSRNDPPGQPAKSKNGTGMHVLLIKRAQAMAECLETDIATRPRHKLGMSTNSGALKVLRGCYNLSHFDRFRSYTKVFHRYGHSSRELFFILPPPSPSPCVFVVPAGAKCNKFVCTLVST